MHGTVSLLTWNVLLERSLGKKGMRIWFFSSTHSGASLSLISLKENDSSLYFQGLLEGQYDGIYTTL